MSKKKNLKPLPSLASTLGNNFWLLKSEPTNYNIDDLARDKRTDWTGVRNYQARNFMRDKMREGDIGFFYNSNAEPSGITGLLRICAEARADRTAFDPKSRYFDEKSTDEKPIWECVEVEFLKKFPRIIPLEELRQNPKLKDMALLQKGSRLSVQPVSESEYLEILKILDVDL